MEIEKICDEFDKIALKYISTLSKYYYNSEKDRKKDFIFYYDIWIKGTKLMGEWNKNFFYGSNGKTNRAIN
ncbi:hypothetical protein LCGC14_0566090 [marine sediment metagenome]|uniref:Uncharacterized protein n=1 Tax=marine sediment metagenome TaxID=412755 RepID=A0A0F9U6Y2_9ZZZZ